MAILGRPSQADDQRAAAWRNWLQRQNPLAIAAFVLGALSLTHGGTLILDGVAGVVLGIIALAQLRRLRHSPGPAAPPTAVPLTAAPPTNPYAILYEAMPSILPRDKGHGLAWGGIALGAMSLAIGAYLYSLRPSAPATNAAATRPATLPR